MQAEIEQHRLRDVKSNQLIDEMARNIQDLEDQVRKVSSITRAVLNPEPIRFWFIATVKKFPFLERLPIVELTLGHQIPNFKYGLFL